MSKIKKANRSILSIFILSVLMLAVLSSCSTAADSTAANSTAANSSATNPPPSSPPSPSTQNDDGGQDVSDDLILRIGYSGSLCEAPLHIAYEKGYFEAEGLKVELIKLAPGTAFEVVTADQMDASFALIANLIQPLSNGLPIKITTGLHTGCDKVLVKKDSGIETAEDFKGKKIGVPSMSSSPIIFTKRVLADAGIGVSVEKSEVEFIVYSTADLPLALENGAVDAIAMNDPTATIAASEYDLNIIFNSAIDEPYNEQYCCAAYVRDNIASDHPEIATKYTVAMQKASAWVQENQDETAKIQVDNNWVAGDAEVNAKILKTYNYIPSVSRAYDDFGVTAKQLQQVGMLDKDVDVDALHKNSFAFLEGIPEEYK